MSGEGTDGRGPQGSSSTTAAVRSSPEDRPDSPGPAADPEGTTHPSPDEGHPAPEEGSRPDRSGVDATTVRTPAGGPGVTGRPGAQAATGGASRGLDAPTTHVDAATQRAGRGRDAGWAGDGPGRTPHRPGPTPPPPGSWTPGSSTPGSSTPGSGPMSAPPADGPLPGTMIIDRYRLVAEVGADRDAEAALWKARDVMLERDVAVTLLVGGWQADVRAASALSRATRSAHFEHPHAARVLDVVRPGATHLPTGVLGAAVAEWTPGRALAELVGRGPLRPSAALRVVEPLASAVAAAHRSGLVLGLEHPQRVRVNPRAAGRLAFPMPRAGATVPDDVRGLGAVLYLLLTARWPVAAAAPDGAPAPAGLHAAPRTPTGAPVPARSLRPDLPVELAALVDRTLDTQGGIRTAAAVHRLVSQLREGAEDDGVLLPVVEDGEQLDEDSPTVWHPDDEPESAPDPERQRKLRIGVTVLVLATLAIVGYVAFQLVSLVGGGSSSPPLVIPTQTAPPAPPSPPPPPAAAPAPPAPVPAGPVQLSSVAVYDPSGEPDNPAEVDRAVDRDPSTSWSTVTYRQQLPALKPGIGIMTTFRAPAAVGGVTVRSPSPGTRVEVRSAPAANVPLSRTQLLGSATVPSEGDEVRIPVQAAPPTGNLLIWITTLGRDGEDGFSSELSEVTIERARG